MTLNYKIQTLFENLHNYSEISYHFIILFVFIYIYNIYIKILFFIGRLFIKFFIYLKIHRNIDFPWICFSFFYEFLNVIWIIYLIIIIKSFILSLCKILLWEQNNFHKYSFFVYVGVGTRKISKLKSIILIFKLIIVYNLLKIYLNLLERYIIKKP